MSFDIRHPSITGKTDTEKLQQIRSYLYQLTPQLNWALNTLETAGTGATTNIVAAQPKAASAISESSEKKINNFNEIKALIIKSAEVVEAFYDQIATTLVSEYKAVAEGTGTYEEVASNNIQTGADGMKQVFGNIQKLEGNFNELFTDDTESVYLIKSNAYIKSGVVSTGENGEPVYGVEVGQVSTKDGETVYSGVARFMPTRLSFYDSAGGREVAYISNQQLFITSGEITEVLRIGNYEISFSPTTGLSFKWVDKPEE